MRGVPGTVEVFGVGERSSGVDPREHPDGKQPLGLGPGHGPDESRRMRYPRIGTESKTWLRPQLQNSELSSGLP